MHTLDRFTLHGKIAVVTGGAGLFGKPISLALAEAGALVVIASRDESASGQYVEALAQQGLKAVAMPLDLAVEASISKLTSDVYDAYGAIDILVNNAVSRQGFDNLDSMTAENWNAAQQVNSTGLMLITQSVLRVMQQQGHGNIINISSIQGVGGPNFPVYGETGMTSPVNYTYDKWGMIGFTKWIANYYGRFNIRANCISPGGYGPGVEASVGDNEFVRNYKRLTPMQRFAFDDDIKGPIVFLASEASSYVTGHNLLVDGGWTNW